MFMIKIFKIYKEKKLYYVVKYIKTNCTYQVLY